MAKLYEIARDIENFEFQFDEETGEVLNEAELDELKMNFNEKIENIGLFIKNLSSDIEAYKAEKKTFDAKIKSAENKIEWLKKYLVFALQGEKFKTPRVSISYRKSQQVLTPDNAENVDEKYRRYKVEIDKSAIKEALNNGEKIHNCSLIEKNNVVVK